MTSMGVRGSHIPSAAGSVDPARKPQPKKTPQPNNGAKAKTSKPKSGKKR